MAKRRRQHHPLQRALQRAILTLALSAGALGAAALGAPGAAWSQDGEKDAERRAEIISRYKSLLESNPQEGFVFNQLLKEVGYGQQLERLIEDYQAKANKNPNSLAYRLILGHLYKAARRYPEALEAYEAAVKVDGKNSDAWLGKGLTLQLLKRSAESQAAFEEALKLQKDVARKQDILRKLADLAFTRRDWDAADRFYGELLKLEPGNEDLRVEYAEVLVQYKRYDKALEQYEQLRKMSGRNVKARLDAMKRIGDVYALMERYDEAVQLWRSAMGQVAGDSYLQRELEQRIIDVYRAKDDLPALIKHYEERWKAPSHDQAMTLAGLYDETGDETKALDMYRRALKSNPKSIDARLKVVRLLERRGDSKGVVAEYKALMKSDPTQTSYSFELAELYWREGNKREAMATLEGLGRKFASDPVVQTNVAELYMQWGARDKALKVYETLVRIAPGDPTHLIALGEFHWVEGEREKALAIWKKILTTMPVRHEAHAELGQVYADHNLIDESVAEFEQAIKLDPDNEKYYRRLAEVYERSRRMSKAIDTWTLVLEKSRQDFTRREARSRIIQLHQRRGTLRAKLTEFKQGFEKTPPDLEAGYFLGEAWIALKDFPRAEAVFEKLVELTGGNTQALLSLNRIYTETQEHRKNIEVLRKIAQADPLRAREYYHTMAELSLKLYEDDQALELAKIPVDLNPNDANAHARLARIYRQMQDLPRAAAEYRVAIDLDDLEFPTYFELAEVYMAMDQVREADGLYKTLIKKARDETDVQRAGRRAIDINHSLGTLPELEKVFIPLLSAQPPRKIYSQLLIELYDLMTREPVARAQNGTAEEREAAERELADISRRALGPLLVALNDDDPSLRLTTIRILGDLGNGNAALPLARLLEESDPAVRVQAALAVGRLGDARGLQPMIRAADDRERTIRQIAVWAIGRMGSKDALKTLEGLLDDAEWSIRALAAIGIGRVGEGRSAKLLGNSLVDPRLRDGRVEVRVSTAWALGALATPEAQQFLIQALRADPDANVRRQAAWALGNINSPGALDALLTAYWGGDGEVREVAGKALLRLGADPGAKTQRPPYVEWEENLGFFDEARNTLDVQLLIDLLLSRELLAHVGRGDAAILQGEEIIGRLLTEQLKRGDADQVSAVLADLDQHPDTLSLGWLTHAPADEPARQAKVREALGRIARRLVPTLIPLLQSDDPTVRALAAGVLGKTGDKAATDTLITALQDPSPEVRRKAAIALGALADPKAAQALLRALQDDFWGTRAYAARSLGQLGEKSVSTALTRALDDTYPWVQACAAEGLGLLGDRANTPALIQRLDAAHPAVRIEILRALARLGGDDAKRALEPYRNDPDPAIREATVPPPA